ALDQRIKEDAVIEHLRVLRLPERRIELVLFAGNGSQLAVQLGELRARGRGLASAGKNVDELAQQQNHENNDCRDGTDERGAGTPKRLACEIDGDADHAATDSR